MPFAGVDTKVSDILATDADDSSSEIRANLGYADGTSEAQGIGASSPVWQQFGFTSRVADPDSDGAAMALSQQVGDQRFVVATRDMRSHGKLPQLKSGEAMMFGAAGQFIRCSADGSISMMTTDDATPNGRSITFRMSPTDGFEWSCPWARIKAGPMGIHLVHSSGARLDLGSVGGSILGPLEAAGVNSYANLQGAMCSVHGAAVSVGTDAGASNFAAATALGAAVTALQAALASINTAIATFVPGSAAHFDPTNAAAVVTAVGAAASAVSTFSAIALNIGKVA